MKRIARLMGIFGALAVTGLGYADLAHAQQAHTPLGLEWVAVDLDRLDGMRGGFVTPTGMMLSFGIERVAFINGELVAAARINIPDISTMTVEQAQGLSALNETLLVQVGADNTFQPSGMQGVVIQNTLDGQQISTLTTLNVSVSTLGMFQEMNTYGALHGALINAAGGP
ncbi:hypothetical protein ACFQZQ_02265 [Lysobacter koreensis]|uniref:PASTA domain-containing protein n=1 Tax=Lysobacter koreensis TaxID=266122 RepID=A0ABW2YKC8_9GAMM